MRDPRMSRRLSQAPRMSLVWTAINIDNTLVEDDVNMADDQDASKRGSLRDFCCNHVKSIATIVMVFGMIFCVVMIVMVHKRDYDINEDKYVSGCHDIAIIGAGISGAYTAWRLRHHDQDIHVYELSDRIGGMFHTKFDGSVFPDLYLDVGVTSFNPEQNPLLNHTIHAMQLEQLTSPLQSQESPTYYLRGKHLTMNNFKSSRDMPYNLKWREKHKTPIELQKYLIKEELDNNTSFLNALLQKTRDGMSLYKQGYENVIGRVASQEAMSFLRDTTKWRHLASNDNAALLGNVPFDMGDNVGEQWTVVGGMQTIPKAMIAEFTRHHRHGFSPYRKLSCIRHKLGVYHLIFIKTYRKDGKMVEHRDSEETCARKVVLAVPPEALKHIEWSPYDEGTLYKETLNSVQIYPVLRVYFVYASAWWGEDMEPRYTDVYTDLPIRHFKYLSSYNDDLGVRHYVFMVAEVDGSDLPYLQNLLNMREFDGQAVYYCNRTKYLIDEITRHIAVIFNHPVENIPTPRNIIVQDWTNDPSTGSWYVWKRGVLWKDVAKNITKPVEKEDVFVVGSGFCGGLCQLSVDGALKTVDDVVDKYLI